MTRKRKKLFTHSPFHQNMNRLVIPELKVAAVKPNADKPAASLGCYTIGDDVAKVALLMCEGKGNGTDVATPAKGKYSVISV